MQYKRFLSLAQCLAPPFGKRTTLMEPKDRGFTKFFWGHFGLLLVMETHS